MLRVPDRNLNNTCLARIFREGNPAARTRGRFNGRRKDGRGKEKKKKSGREREEREKKKKVAASRQLFVLGRRKIKRTTERNKVKRGKQRQQQQSPVTFAQHSLLNVKIPRAEIRCSPGDATDSSPPPTLLLRPDAPSASILLAAVRFLKISRSFALRSGEISRASSRPLNLRRPFYRQ